VFTILGIFRFCRIALFVDITSEGSLRNAPRVNPLSLFIGRYTRESKEQTSVIGLSCAVDQLLDIRKVTATTTTVIT